MRRSKRTFDDSGSSAGWALAILALITVAFFAFVVWKYVLPEDDGAPEPTLTVYTTAPYVPEEARFDGTWTGHVTGDVHTYDIEVVIVDNGDMLMGDVEYTWNPDRPGVDDCEGTWTQTSRHGRHADVHEVITSGPCIDEVDITLDMKPNGTVAFAVFYGNDYFPTAILTSE
jgi:hypothetical protein